MDDVPNQSIDPKIYLNRFASEDAIIEENVHPNTGIIVVIPCFAEPDLNKTLNSLFQNETTHCFVEVIVVVNGSENTTEDDQLLNELNIRTIQDLRNKSPQKIQLNFVDQRSLPPKKAGVGLARKIGMDEAIRRFASIKKEGVIVCLDADCTVSVNYLNAIEQHFFVHFPKTNGASLYYEHPFETINDTVLKNGIVDYELHLRYFILCQEFCGCPYAFHTVGSSMAVRASAYQKQGGMNTRKAGEDFYFLQKIIQLGDFTKLQDLCVYPSPRISKRVPFGTGRAQGDYVQSNEFQTYNFDIFIELKKFIQLFTEFHHHSKPNLSNVHEQIIDFLHHQNFMEALSEIKRNTQSQKSFGKRLWAWFNAFRLMKLVHHLRDHGFPNQLVSKSSRRLLSHFTDEDTTSFGSEELLLRYREIEQDMPKKKRGG